MQNRRVEESSNKLPHNRIQKKKKISMTIVRVKREKKVGKVGRDERTENETML